MTRVRTAILISGRGSNMKCLVEAAKTRDYPAEVVAVISNRPEAPGLEFARAAGIEAFAIDHKTFPDRDAFDHALDAALAARRTELVACAGFMRIMTPWLVNRWTARMINIHPSLLPLYQGLRTHERALADGAKEHGCTVHYVDEEVDTGPVIMQARVPVLAGDTPDSLAARVLAAEHRIYPLALAEAARAQAKTS